MAAAAETLDSWLIRNGYDEGCPIFTEVRKLCDTLAELQALTDDDFSTMNVKIGAFRAFKLKLTDLETQSSIPMQAN